MEAERLERALLILDRRRARLVVEPDEPASEIAGDSLLKGLKRWVPERDEVGGGKSSADRSLGVGVSGMNHEAGRLL